jgi:hypothetical protein
MWERRLYRPMHCIEGYKGKIASNGAFLAGGLRCVTVFTYIKRTRSCETSPKAGHCCVLDYCSLYAYYLCVRSMVLTRLWVPLYKVVICAQALSDTGSGSA